MNPMRKHRKYGGQIFSGNTKVCHIALSGHDVPGAFDRVGGFDEEFPPATIDLWLRICHQYEVAYIDRPLIRKYGGHEDQLSAKYSGYGPIPGPSTGQTADAVHAEQ